MWLTSEIAALLLTPVFGFTLCAVLICTFRLDRVND